MIAAYPAAQFFAAPVLGSLADYWGRKPVLIVSQAGTVLSWLLFMVAYWVDDGLYASTKEKRTAQGPKPNAATIALND